MYKLFTAVQCNSIISDSFHVTFHSLWLALSLELFWPTVALKFCNTECTKLNYQNESHSELKYTSYTCIKR